MFAGLDNDEEDELLLELDQAVPTQSSRLQGMGLDRDASKKKRGMQPGNLNTSIVSDDGSPSPDFGFGAPRPSSTVPTDRLNARNNAASPPPANGMSRAGLARVASPVPFSEMDSDSDSSSSSSSGSDSDGPGTLV